MSRSAPTAEVRCSELVELVTAYFDGALSVAETETLDAHLEECQGCDAYVDQFRETITALGGLREGGLDPEVRTKLLDAFRAMRAGDPPV